MLPISAIGRLQEHRMHIELKAERLGVEGDRRIDSANDIANVDARASK